MAYSTVPTMPPMTEYEEDMAMHAVAQFLVDLHREGITRDTLIWIVRKFGGRE